MQNNDKKAACVLVWSEDRTKILAVSRKNDKTAFGIPGGKVDSGETFLEAAIRETLEETGYTVQISPTSMLNPFESHIDGYLTQTFVATIQEGVEKKQTHVEETGVVSFIATEVLLQGPFAKYNEQLLEWYESSVLKKS